MIYNIYIIVLYPSFREDEEEYTKNILLKGGQPSCSSLCLLINKPTSNVANKSYLSDKYMVLGRA